jgi:hypothetical protein
MHILHAPCIRCKTRHLTIKQRLSTFALASSVVIFVVAIPHMIISAFAARSLAARLFLGLSSALEQAGSWLMKSAGLGWIGVLMNAAAALGIGIAVLQVYRWLLIFRFDRGSLFRSIPQRCHCGLGMRPTDPI